MSGILAIASRHKRPADPMLLQRMMAALARRGPDGSATWCSDAICLGHTLFRTVEDVEPLGLASLENGALWLAADARIDGRDALRRELTACGQVVPANAPDEILILHAYRAWGETCPEHLLGDFAFILWDDRRHLLFAARDHFGVKPLYYAHTDDALLLSNSVAALRTHPALPDELDEEAVADFLLFGQYQDVTRTIYAAIRALPPAHALIWRAGAPSPQLRRYWSLPTDGEIRYKNPDAYVQHFRELLGQAVRDRLRTSRVSILMSGGLDSTSVAAMARAAGARSLRAFTLDSRYYVQKEREIFPSREAADHLHIPLSVINVDGYRLFEGWDRPDWDIAQPQADPLWKLSVDLYRRMAEHGRVALTGQGGDPALYPSRGYLLTQLKGFRWRSLVAAFRHYHQATGQWPPLYLRTQLTGGRSDQRHRLRPPAFDFWFQPDFVQRMRLPQRWEAWRAGMEHLADAPHPLRPEAWASLNAPLWAHLFTQAYDIETGGASLEFRHPYFDVRLIEYLLALPPLPWFEAKFIVRQALAGRIPETVRTRPKSVLNRSLATILIGFDNFDIMLLKNVINALRNNGAEYLDFDNISMALTMHKKINQEEAEQLLSILTFFQWMSSVR